MATRSSILAQKIPRTEEPGGPLGCKELDMTEHTHISKGHHICAQPRAKITQKKQAELSGGNFKYILRY